jgi:two-component system NtrC family sensor kinase
MTLLRQLAPMAGLSIAASLALFGIVSAGERSHAEESFRDIARQHLIAIRTNIAVAEHSVDILVRHFVVSDANATGRGDFEYLVTPMIARYPFIQAFSWNALVTPPDRKSHEDLARSDGLESYRIWERDASGQAIPVPHRPYYVPISYIEPMASNAPALGFDLASNPLRRAALESGRVDGRMKTTGRITLVQDKAEQYGVLLLGAVYCQSSTETLSGYVSGVFRITDLIEGSAAGAGLAPGRVDIALHDLNADEDSRRLFPRHGTRTMEDLLAMEHVAETFEIGGRSWMLIATPNVAFWKNNIYHSSYLILAITIIASIFYLYALAGRMIQASESTTLARELAASKRRLDQSQKIARLGYIEVAQSARTVTIGHEAGRLLGLGTHAPEEDLARFLDAVHPDDRDTLEKALRESSGFDLEFRVGSITLHAQAKAADQDDTLLVIIQDVTRRKGVEDERAQMIARIAEADRLQALGTMAGGIAHEINTPMQYVGDNIVFMKHGMQSLLELGRIARSALADEHDLAEVGRMAGALDLEFLQAELPLAAEQALDGTARIAKIVQAIREFSYPSSQMSQTVDMNHLAAMVSTVTRNQWKYVAELHLDLDPNLPRINAVEGEINQVLVNLLVNAAQAIEEQKRPELGSIKIITRNLGKEIELVVADNGPGIPPEIRKQVFDLFFTTKPPGKGTGQGLAITRSIILRHRGEISVTSPPEGGTRFCVRLPVEASQSADERVPALQEPLF